MSKVIAAPYPVLSMREFVAQGTTPGQILSMAAYQQRIGTPAAMKKADRLRSTAHAVATELGIDTSAWRGAKRHPKPVRSGDMRRAA